MSDFAPLAGSAPKGREDIFMRAQRPTGNGGSRPDSKGVLITISISCSVSGSNRLRASVGGAPAHPNVARSRSNGPPQAGSVGRSLHPRVRLRLREGKKKDRCSRALLRLAGNNFEGDCLQGGVGLGRRSISVDHPECASVLEEP